MTNSEVRRFGSVAVAGLANAGKSTLVNRVVGAPVSIVTRKAQTTRRLVRGVACIGLSQVALVDTPGLVAPRGQREQRLLQQAWHGVEAADAVAVIVDAAASNRSLPAALERLDWRLRGPDSPPASSPWALVLNKVDRIKRDSLLPLAASLGQTTQFDVTFMVSAKTGSGIEQLRDWMAAAMPEGEWQYPAGSYCDQSDRWRAEETTRRQLLLKLHGELPYYLSVATDSWRQEEDGTVEIAQTVFVKRESQRRIAWGKEGRTLAAIKAAAAKEIMKILGRRVRLDIRVKVRRNTRGSDLGAEVSQERLR